MIKQTPRLSIATYNLHGNASALFDLFEFFPKEKKEENFGTEREEFKSEDELQEEKEPLFDIICFNEANKSAIQYVQNQMNSFYKNWAFSCCHGQFGNGIFSKFEIVFSQSWILKSKSEKEHSRSLLYVKLKNTTKKFDFFHLFLTHLENLSEEIRLAQIQEVFQIIESQDFKNILEEPCFLVGDFNCLNRNDYADKQWLEIIAFREKKQWQRFEPETKVYDFIRGKGFFDAFKKLQNDSEKAFFTKGSFETAWVQNPLLRIDYIFGNSLLFSTVEKIEDLNQDRKFISTKSDHFPVCLSFL